MGSAPKSAPDKKSRRRFTLTLVMVLALFGATIGAVLYLTSDGFRDYVRTRVIAQLEQITGGRVELGSLTWNLSHLEVNAENLTIHGLEGADQEPYAHVDHMRLQLKIFSLLEQDLGIRYLQLDRPVFHLIVYPDGHTNQPVPPKAAITVKPDIQQLFHLELDRADVRYGTVIINERRMPLDMSARDVDAEISYAARGNEYQGKLKLGDLTLGYRNFLPTKASAEIEFSVLQDQFNLKSARINTAKSSVILSAQLTKFANPTVEGSFIAALNLAELGPLTGNPELRDGTGEVRGSIRYFAGSYASAGKLAVRSLQYRDKQFSVRDVDAAADYALDPKRIAVRNIVARAFAGIVRGEGTVDNWLTLPAVQPSIKTAKAPAVQQVGFAQLRLDNVSAAKLLDGVSTPSLQLSRLHSAGVINGGLEVRWKGTIAAAVLGVNATVTPPSGAVAGQAPLDADVHGSYELATKRLNLAQFTANVPDVHLSGTGSLGRRNEQLNVRVSVDDLSKLQPILIALNQSIPALNGITGKGSFHGSVSNIATAPVVNGHLELHEFGVPLALIQQSPAILAPVATGEEGSDRIQLDSLSVDINYSPNDLILRNGVARHQQSKANFGFTSHLAEGQFTPASQISGHVSLQDSDIAELQKVLGYSYPIEGRISASLQLGGTKASPEGSGRVQVSDAEVYGEPVKAIVGDISFSSTRITASHLDIVQNGARATASGYYRLPQFGISIYRDRRESRTG